jgi:hypothetical protein
VNVKWIFLGLAKKRKAANLLMCQIPPGKQSKIKSKFRVNYIPHLKDITENFKLIFPEMKLRGGVIPSKIGGPIVGIYI